MSTKRLERVGIVTRLALVRIRSHPGRSATLAAAVLLTTLLFGTVMSITVGIAQSAELSMQLATGSRAHATIDDGFDGVAPDELLSRVERADGIDEAVLLSVTRSYTDGITDERHKNKAIIAIDGKKPLDMLFCELTEGRFPDSSDEIILDRESYPDLKVGDRVKFATTTALENENGALVGVPVELEFTVSGFIETMADRPFFAITRFEPELLELVGMENKWSVYLTFESSFDIASRMERLIGSLRELSTGELVYYINNAFIGADPLEFIKNPANVALVLVSLGVVFFAAFLLIYNIASISLTSDMRHYGLLGVIGMTHAQQKRMNLISALVIGLSVMPLGLVLVYFVGWRLLMPLFMAMSGEILPYSFSAAIPILTALLTLGVLCFSELLPLRRIRDLPPIEAIDSREPLELFSKSSRIPRHRRGRATATVTRIVTASLGREPKRTLVTSLSAGLSILLFVVIGAISDAVYDISMSQIQHYDSYVRFFRDTDYGSQITGLDNHGALPEGLQSELAALPEVESVELYYYSELDVSLNARLAERIESYLSRYDGAFASSYQPILDSGLIESYVIGVPDSVWERIRLDQDVVLGDHPELMGEGRMISVGSGGEYSISFADGETIASDALSRDYSAVLSKSYTGTVSHLIGSIHGGIESAIFVLPMSSYEREFEPEARMLLSIAMDADEGGEAALARSVEAVLERYNADRTPKYYEVIESDGTVNTLEWYDYLAASNVTDDFDTLHTRMTAINTVGYSLAAIVLLIGVINMMNSALTSAMLRRREYAMLEAIGMTSRQLGLSLMLENSFTAVIAGVTLALGAPLVGYLMESAFDLAIDVKLGFALVMLGVVILVSIAASLAAYASLRREPCVERIRRE